MCSEQLWPKKLHQRGIHSICKTVNRAVSIALGMLADPTKTGGYFCLLDIKTGTILITTIIGSVSPEKAAKYKRLAEEKALRLYERHIAWTDHVSSFQSEDETSERYGGSVLGDRFIYSFSGFPPIYDEAVMLATAHRHQDMPEERRAKIIQFSRPSGDHPATSIITKLAA